MRYQLLRPPLVLQVLVVSRVAVAVLSWQGHTLLVMDLQTRVSQKDTLGHLQVVQTGVGPEGVLQVVRVGRKRRVVALATLRCVVMAGH